MPAVEPLRRARYVKNCRQVAADIVELISREEKKGVVGGVQNRLPRCVCWQASPSAEPDIPFHLYGWSQLELRPQIHHHR